MTTHVLKTVFNVGDKVAYGYEIFTIVGVHDVGHTRVGDNEWAVCFAYDATDYAGRNQVLMEDHLTLWRSREYLATRSDTNESLDYTEERQRHMGLVR